MNEFSEAFYEAVMAVGSHVVTKPLPPGLTAVETDKWKLAVNNGEKPVPFEGSEIPGYSVAAFHKEFIVISLIGPDGGLIGGGMTEQEFIDEMRAAQKEAA